MRLLTSVMILLEFRIYSMMMCGKCTHDAYSSTNESVERLALMSGKHTERKEQTHTFPTGKYSLGAFATVP